MSGWSPLSLTPSACATRRGDQRGVGNGGERHEEDAVLELVQEVRRRLQGQAGLARAPRTGEGKEAHLGSQKPPSDLLHLPLAPDERGGLHGQVVRAALERPQRREIGGQIRRQELEDALGAGEVLQAVFPQIPQLCTHRQLVPHQLLGRQREERLPPVTRRQEPGDPVQGRAEVVPVPLLGAPCVQGHAHQQGSVLTPVFVYQQRSLGREGRLQGLGGGGECGAEGVSHRLEYVAPVGFDGAPQDLVVAGEGGTHPLRVPLPHLARALYVREQESYRAAGRSRHLLTRPPSPQATSSSDTIAPATLPQKPKASRSRETSTGPSKTA